MRSADNDHPNEKRPEGPAHEAVPALRVSIDLWGRQPARPHGRAYPMPPTSRLNVWTRRFASFCKSPAQKKNPARIQAKPGFLLKVIGFQSKTIPFREQTAPSGPSRKTARWI